jgi:ATP-dependent DNA helicase DinG
VARSHESPAAWFAAEARTGTRHLAAPAMRAAMASPFDYPNATRVLIVKDVPRDDTDQVAAAYRELFLAAGGGALGLFTAIGRLRAVHQRIAPALEEAGLPLYAQHVGGMDAATLVDIFRAEEHSCLLGTDAVRDGVDVPGRSLRLIVFDRVPWPRPDILHRARKAAWKAAGAGANAYDDMLARLRLKQAYGRLIRRADDRGVFVMLDSRLPSRLLSAFPAGVSVERLGLSEAVDRVQGFVEPV